MKLSLSCSQELSIRQTLICSMCGSEFDRDSNAKSFINPYLTIFKMSDEKQIYHLSGQTSVSQLQDIMTIGVDGYDVTECYICGKQVYVQGRDAPQEWIDKVITHILRKSSKDLNLGKHFTDEQQQELWMLAKQIIEKNIISHTINY